MNNHEWYCFFDIKSSILGSIFHSWIRKHDLTYNQFLYLFLYRRKWIILLFYTSMLFVNGFMVVSEISVHFPFKFFNDIRNFNDNLQLTVLQV